jgi:hypothetical protein
MPSWSVVIVFAVLASCAAYRELALGLTGVR